MATILGPRERGPVRTWDIDSFFDSAGVRIRYVERGEGEPVALVHSYTGNLEDQWIKSGVLHALAACYHVIAFDARGHGQSDKPHDPAAYGAEMTWDIARLLDHLRIDRAHIIGYSMGAHVVAQLLTLAPERFITAILGGACGRHNWSAEDERRAEEEASEMEQGLLVKQLTRLSPADQPPPDAAQLEARSAELLAGKDRYALAALRRATRSQVVTAEQMANAHVPVLGIVGSADPYRASFDALSDHMPDMTLTVPEGATHVSATTHPEFIPSILTFLRTHPSS
jgi:pimeloyl-ACP methyl ester carboxylesterase